MVVTLSLEVPEGAFSVLRQSPEEFGRSLMEAAVCKWYELGWISQSKAAEVLGTSRHDLLTVLGRHGVSPFQETREELAGE
jgi:hypothetical protein